MTLQEHKWGFAPGSNCPTACRSSRPTNPFDGHRLPDCRNPLEERLFQEVRGMTRTNGDLERPSHSSSLVAEKSSPDIAHGFSRCQDFAITMRAATRT